MHDIIQVCVQRPRGGVVVEHQAVSKPGTVLNLVGTSTFEAINGKTINPLIYNVIHWFAGLLGQWNIKLVDQATVSDRVPKKDSANFESDASMICL